MKKILLTFILFITWLIFWSVFWNELSYEEETFLYSIEDSAKALGLNLPIFKTILKTFLGSINKDLKELKIHIDNKDFEQIKNIAHKIKGASGNLKINNVYEITKDIEFSAKEEIASDYIAKFEKLEKCTKDIRKTYEESS